MCHPRGEDDGTRNLGKTGGGGGGSERASDREALPFPAPNPSRGRSMRPTPREGEILSPQSDRFCLLFWGRALCHSAMGYLRSYISPPNPGREHTSKNTKRVPDAEAEKGFTSREGGNSEKKTPVVTDMIVGGVWWVSIETTQVKKVPSQKPRRTANRNLPTLHAIRDMSLVSIFHFPAIHSPITRCAYGIASGIYPSRECSQEHFHSRSSLVP